MSDPLVTSLLNVITIQQQRINELEMLNIKLLQDRLTGRTPDFDSGNTGSKPVPVTK